MDKPIDFTRMHEAQIAREAAYPIDCTSIVTELEGLAATPRNDFRRPQSPSEVIRILQVAAERLPACVGEPEAGKPYAAELSRALAALAEIIGPRCTMRISTAEGVDTHELSNLRDLIVAGQKEADFVLVLNYPIDVVVSRGREPRRYTLEEIEAAWGATPYRNPDGSLHRVNLLKTLSAPKA